MPESTVTRAAADSGRGDLPTSFRWKALDKAEEKNWDWYWAVGIIAISLSIASSFFGNHLLGFLIVIIGITLIILESKPAEETEIMVDRRGVRVGDHIYPYQELESFWVDEKEEQEEPVLLLKSQKLLAPMVVVPIDPEAANPGDLADYLVEFIDEEEMEEPLTQKVMEWIGF